VLRNLLGNAAKYTPPRRRSRTAMGVPGGVVRIEVADEGPGIHPDDAEAIFEKYRRGRQSGNRNVAGAGIGLYVSRRIVQAHGSDLTLSSRPGAGAVFGFELPLDG
jgi:two-component system, NtrC family, sensor histidine kinase KinB